MDKNPQQLSDDELDATIEQLLTGVEPAEQEEEEKPKKPETPPADPAEEELPKEEEGKKPAPKQEEEGEKKPEEPKKSEGEPSRREQLRIEKLLQKYPQLQAQPKEEPKAPVTPTVDGLFDYDNDLDADDELKTRLKADRDAAVKAAVEAAKKDGTNVEQQLATNLFRTRLEIDAPRVEAKYTFLDKNSDDFNPRAASAMNMKYLRHVGFDPKTKTVTDPDTRYSDFVEAEMEFSREVIAREVVDTQKEVAKQAAQTGLRPGGGTPKPKLNLNKLPHQMSDEELDAAIAQGLSLR